MFNDKYFIFDGVRSKDFNIAIVSVGDNDTDRQFGIKRNITEVDGVNVPIFTGVENECPTKNITIAKLDSYNEIIPFNKGEKDRISSWLFKNEYKPFISMDDENKVYYVMFTEGNIYTNGLEQGYINLTMRLSSPYAYSNVMNDFVRVSKYKEINIFNDNNINEDIIPDIEIEMLGDSNKIEILNKMNGSRFSLKDLEKGEHVRVYGDSLLDIVSLKDKEKNLFEKSNKDFLRLRNGRNKIEIKVNGIADVKIIYQYPLAIN